MMIYSNFSFIPNFFILIHIVFSGFSISWCHLLYHSLVQYIFGHQKISKLFYGKLSMKTILDKYQLNITIQRLSHQLMENHGNFSNSVLIGMQPRGVYLADKIVDQLKKTDSEYNINYGKLDITFYRDDIRQHLHVPAQTNISFSIEGKKVILIDDVLYTGRTVRAALDALLDFGRPEKVELCVLIDRKFSRQLPIHPDYCGKAIDSIVSQRIKVEWDKEEVILY